MRDGTESRPLVVAFDGSSEARAAVRAASELMPGRRLLVTTVWEPSPIAPPQSLGMPYARPDSEEIEAFDRAEHDDAATTAEVGARRPRPRCRGGGGRPVRRRRLVSETTVKTHVARVLMKLGVRDRVQAVVLAYEAGVVAPGVTSTE